MVTKAAPTAKKQNETYRTSVSLPRDLHRSALKRAANDRRAFSTYIQILIERDLAN